MAAATAPQKDHEEYESWKEGSWIINSSRVNQDPDDPYMLWHQHSETFIRLIQEQRHAGYGFIPFIGAGFSAPSGAPLVDEIKWYLQRCIYLALQDEGGDNYRWHPRTDLWPPLIDYLDKDDKDDKEQVLGSNHWLGEISKLDLYAKGNGHADLEEELIVRRQGYGSATEWRTALLFLSRLNHGPRDRQDVGTPISLDVPLQEIIDSCLRAVLKNKYPTLEHNMLGVLAGALRLDLVLTTNFDNLLERAFAAARNPFELFEVHLGDSLPHWSAVSEVRSLVKLHGNRHSLRADYSLDSPPSEEDKQRFLEYLLSGVGRSAWASRILKAGGKDDPLDFQNHLLLMGCSGRERRTLAFIEHAWKHLKPGFRVFWLCHSNRDVDQIRQVTREFCDRSGRPDAKCSVILRHPNPGLLLLQLYQTIRGNLPPLGGLFPSVSRLTLPPLPTTYGRKSRPAVSIPDSEKFAKKVSQCLRDFRQRQDSKPRKLVVVSSANEVRGVTSECGRVFRDMEKDSICLWLDMNDISSADNLFEVLLEAAYFRLGLENWVPVYRETEKAGRTDEIARLARSVNKHWVIFLNARETPGANTDEALDVFDPNRPHGWLDDEDFRHEVLADKSSSVRPFLNLLDDLCGPKSPRISVVLMCRDNPNKPLLMRWLEKLVQKQNPQTGYHVRLDVKEGIDFSEEEIVADSIAWTAEKGPVEGNHRRRFLHALVLMQRPRLLATIWSEAASLRDEPPEIADKKQEWLRELEDKGLLRRKAGGFIWMHLRCRQRIRDILHDPSKLTSRYTAASAALHGWTPKEDEGDLHTELAKWYEKVLDASENPAAVFEALYHFCRAAQRFAGHDVVRARQRLEAASALLKVNSLLIQTQGYARGSCRRLGHIRTLCRPLEKEEPELWPAVRRLQRTCTEVMRAIAREVGENAKGYLRHRQLAELYFLDAGSDLTETIGKGSNHNHFSDKLIEELRKKSESESVDAACELMRWHRWSGMLAMASRSYNQAESAFRWARGIEKPPEWFTRSLQTRPQPPKLLLERLRVAEQHVELLLQRYSLEARRISLGLRGACDLKQTLKDVESYIAEGRDFVSQIRGRDHSSEPHYTMSANWCECRLLMHLSICTSLRSTMEPRRPLDPAAILNKAMALLGDSEAALRIADPRRYRAELGMVELHRAEARLHAADAVAIENTEWTFGAMCRHLRGIDLRFVDWDSDPAYRRLLEADTRVKAQEALRRAKSLVADGMRFLDRAEPVLRERRRNVWWTTWFFEKRLRLIGMAVWASLFEDDVSIPFLGLESAAAGTETIADELLVDAKRMTSVDAYRLATIVDAYASCAKALQFRLKRERSNRLLFRQGEMSRNLERAFGELREVKIRRDEPPPSGLDDKDKMDTEIREYVDEVVMQAEKTYKSLR